MNEDEAVRYLTQCADRQGRHHWSGHVYPANECRTCNGTNDAGHLMVPCSRYGRTSAECAPVAYRVAAIISEEVGEPITLDDLDHAMSLVVNDHDDPAYTLANYGTDAERARWADESAR